MRWLDKLFGRKREADAERADTAKKTKPSSEADILEEEVFEEREEVVLRGKIPPGVG